MLEKIHEKVTVLAGFNRDIGDIIIYKVRWNGRLYLISKMGYHHKVREGRNIHHYFHVNNSSIAFKLKFDTEFLEWWVMEVSDGNP